MVDSLKVCPDCAESVQPAALVCKHCGYRFDQHAGAAGEPQWAQTSPPATPPPPGPAGAWQMPVAPPRSGMSPLAVVGIVIAVIVGLVFGAIFLAVVVFSTRGVTNDSKAAACATEKRTLATAVEAYYAETGADAGSLSTLQDAGLIRDTETLGYAVGPGGVITGTCPS